MAIRRKRDYPVADARRYLEPGPVVLVSSAWRGKANIMTMGWHMVAGFAPSLVACYVWDANHSFGMIRKSRECVINVPTMDLLDTVVDIGNCSGRDVDKFAAFGLTPQPARKVKAPLIGECHASFECRLHDGRWIGRHSIFLFEIVAAQVAPRPKHPRTVHYLGDGAFMVAGRVVSRRSRFRPDRL
jgi:flavin reductase (DIM6/NTAB) family NADH-FMN oxidoreductase RutF